MSIVVYSDVIVPDEVIHAGVTGSQTRENDRSRNKGGFSTVNAVRDVTTRSFQLGVVPMETGLWELVEAMYEVTDAGTYGMLLRDPKDSVVSGSRGALMGYMAGVQSGVSGRGNGGPLYILQKLYSPEGTTRTRARDITRPLGAPAMLRGGTPIVVGVAAGNVSLATGPVYVTFVPDATRTVSGVTVGATTQVTLSSAISGLVTTTGKLWLQGLSGADAALLNNLAHTITNIAGAVYTISTNTAGKAITAGSGQGHKYPQPDETLTWSGSFYVPVHFRDDNLDWAMVAAAEDPEDRLVQGPSVYLDEVRES